MAQGNDFDVRMDAPGRDVEVIFESRVRTLADVWMGDRTWRESIQSGGLSVVGPSQLTRNISPWLKPGVFAESARGPVP